MLARPVLHSVVRSYASVTLTFVGAVCSSCMWSGPTLCGPVLRKGDPELCWCGLLLLYVVRSYVVWSGPTPGDPELGWCGLVLLYVVRSCVAG